MDLRRRMGEILDRASAGERIIVERDRRPLAVLVPFEDAVRLEESAEERRARALAALDRLKSFAQRVTWDESLPDAAALLRDERIHGHGDSG